MVINPSSVSFEAIRQDLMAYIASKPTSQVWKDKYAGSAGTTIIELIAGLGTYLQYAIAAARRESYLFYATARSSGIAVSQNLGYSVGRGRNPVLVLTVTPLVSVILPKFTSLGAYGAYQLYTEDTLSLYEGVTQDINLIIGTLGAETFRVPSSDPQVFRFVSTNISEDLMILLDQYGAGDPQPVWWYSSLNPISSFVDSVYYWVLSNSLGGVDVMYLNTPPAGFSGFQYYSGSMLTCEFIQLFNVPINLGNIPAELTVTTGLDITTIATVNMGSGGIPDYTVIPYVPPETMDSIRINAPIFHEVGACIRGRADYQKLLTQTIEITTGLICVGATGYDDPDTPAIVYLSYVISDDSLLDAGQKNAVLQQLDSYRPYGVEPPVIENPLKSPWNLTVTIALNTTASGYTSLSIQNDIKLILSKYERVLGLTLDAAFQNSLEHLIDQLPYVTVARIVFDAGTPSVLAWNEYLVVNTLTVTATIAA